MPDSAKSITLHFNEFSTYDENDFIMIFNLENNDLLYTLYGSSNPGTLFFNTSKLLLMFHSDAVDNAEGWNLDYTSSTLTGTEPALENFNLSVYPNPANESLKITAYGLGNQPVSLALFDSNGKKALAIHTRIENQKLDEHLNVNDLPEGVYVLQLITDSQVLNRKVVIQH
jgi:hypothetical protein